MSTAKWRFVMLLVGSIGIALTLVVISVALYFSSGTAQLDLSRPGYTSVRSQSKENPYAQFPSSGAITDQTLDEFQTMYQERARSVTSIEQPFNGDALSDATLGIDDTTLQGE
ncbi:MAG: hypothetical protein WAS27_01515 [Candidatus Saccharimonadales bacterium]